MEGLTSAMKLQAEILRRMHERQEEIGQSLKDTSRAEMMISSTRALNESFTGMRRVQERLVDRLTVDRGRRVLLVFGVLLGCAAVVGVLYWGVAQLSQKVEDTGRLIAEPRKDPAAQAALDEISGLRERLGTMEDRDRGQIFDRLERLQEKVNTLEEERRRIQVERDAARESLGAEKAEVVRLRGSVQDLERRFQSSQTEVSRLTGQTMADQKLVAKLNEVIEQLRGGPLVSTAAPPTTGAEKDETPTDNGSEVEADAATSTPTDDSTAPAPDGRRLVSAPFLGDMNQLLTKNRSSEAYVLTTAASFDRDGLNDIVLEVRGQDGSLAKTIYAKKLRTSLNSRGGFLELEFEAGHIDFRQGLTRNIRSPFFNDRYEIVVLGVDGKAWIDAALPFLQVN
jgi:hypothetical protein